ncbi:MAG: hypothetical protein KF703_16925 [Actinobacteria bacterium]|nr:hypothetical protein [Actinomycetota bacterium]
MLLLGVLAYQWYRPWWTTERVTSTSATQVCTAPPDWREGDDPRLVGCFAADLLDAGPEPHVGDCLRLRLEYESADVREARRTSCPASP